MFDFPEPFGPITTATPGSRRTSTGSTNDLKPRSLIAFRCTRGEAIGRRGRRCDPVEVADRHRDLGLTFTDASLVALAARLESMRVAA